MMYMYNLGMENRTKKQIKHLLLEENYMLKELAQMLEEKRGVKCSADSFSHRLGRATITYEEMLDIADILGYEIKFIKKN